MPTDDPVMNLGVMGDNHEPYGTLLIIIPLLLPLLPLLLTELALLLNNNERTRLRLGTALQNSDRVVLQLILKSNRAIYLLLIYVVTVEKVLSIHKN